MTWLLHVAYIALIGTGVIAKNSPFGSCIAKQCTVNGIPLIQRSTRHILSDTEKDQDGLPPVLMHYMPWFKAKLPEHVGVHWQEDWDWSTLSSQNKVASHLAPMIGPYSVSNRTVLRYHLGLMKAAGIKGIIVDWYGTRDSYYDDTSGKIWNHGFVDPDLRGSDALVDAASAAGMLFTVCYEDWTLVVPDGLAWGEQPSGMLLDQARAQMRKDFKYIQKRYISKPGFLRASSGGMTGRPVILTFGPRNMKDKYSWQQTFSSVFPKDDQPMLITLFGKPEVGDGMFSWVPALDPDGDRSDEMTVLSHVSAYLNRFYDASLQTKGGKDSSGGDGGPGVEWQKYENKNCFSAHGGHTGKSLGRQSESSCKELCSADASCDCIVLAKSRNECWSRSDCQIEKCQDAEWADVFVNRNQLSNRISVGSIFPGYHDFYTEGRSNWKSYGRLPEYEGRTFDRTATLAKTRLPSFIQAVTWNDFEEGTCFEPAFGRPTQYTYLLKLQELILGYQNETAFEKVFLASGLARADPPVSNEWLIRGNKNCFSGAGGYGGRSLGGQSASSCKGLCSADATCNCFVLAKNGSECWSRSDCQIEQCQDAEWADVFVKQKWRDLPNSQN